MSVGALSLAPVTPLGPSGEPVARVRVPLPPFTPGAVVALRAACPATLVAMLTDVLDSGAVPLLLHAQTPDTTARRIADAAGAAMLLTSDASSSLDVQLLGGALRIDTPSLVLGTSGTTGALPKLYVFSLERAVANARAHLEALGHAPERILLPVPLSHAFGLVAGPLTARLSGAELFAFAHAPDPATLHDALRTHAIDTVHLTPPLLRLLVKRHARKPLAPLPHLRLVGVGSAPVTRGEVRALAAIFPDADVVVTYGLTECGPRVSTLDVARAGKVVLEGEDDAPAPLGEPLEGVRFVVATVEPEDDDAFSTLRVRTAYLALARIEDGALVPIAQAPFDTGDAVIEHGGALAILGRVDGTIIRGGTNVHPARVEAIALDDEAVDAACLIGLPSALYGEVPVLLVEASGDATLVRARLLARFAEVLVPTDQPAEIRFVAALPRTVLGKVARHLARELAIRGGA